MAKSICVSCGLSVDSSGALQLEYCDPLFCRDDTSDECQGLGLNLGCGLYVDDQGRLDIRTPLTAIVASETANSAGATCPIVGDDTTACAPDVEACYTNDTDCTVVVTPFYDLSVEITDKPHDPATNPFVQFDRSENGQPFVAGSQQPLLTQHSRIDSAQSRLAGGQIRFAREIAPGGRYCHAIRTRFINMDGATLNTYNLGVSLQATGAGVESIFG